MGFRSTLISQDYSDNLPEWFISKYEDYILFTSGLLISSKREAKFYDNVFFEDYQKAVAKSGFWDEGDHIIVIVVLAEDGVITKVQVSKNKIIYISMYEDDQVDHVWDLGY